jgi:outer membrane protein OmpA-like peptidoglycan-associated protein
MKHLLFLILPLFILNSTTALAAPVHFATAEKCATQKAFADSGVILIPFDYKQSALFHQFTFDVIDSVVNLLLKNDKITLSIDGYAHQDEGSDTIVKYLSLNRALFVRDYILGRGVKEDRIIVVQGMGAIRSKNSNVNADGHALNCRAELRLNYPPPPKPVAIPDTDEDGIPDTADACVNEFGYKENNGCPDKETITIPFGFQESSLSSRTYYALDSVISVLRQNPSFTIAIQGHAYAAEGINSVCERLGMERASIVKNYLVSRNISGSRIVSVENFGKRRPCNPGRNPIEIALNSRAQISIKK